MRGIVVQVNLSAGGVPKRPVPEAYLTSLGFEGDISAHNQIHGGPLKAVLLMAAETIDDLAARGYPVFYGATGENITTRGIDPSQMRQGQRYRIGEALIELTSVRIPCSTLDVYGSGLKHELRGVSGFYAAVAEPGIVRAHDIISLVDAAV
ncbi:MAG: MOSC domain-containing protein [Acidobacteria bacterium]|nr:MOSC domain-containing protein [Acidobacteriota bacterium]